MQEPLHRIIEPLEAYFPSVAKLFNSNASYRRIVSGRLGGANLFHPIRRNFHQVPFAHSDHISGVNIVVPVNYANLKHLIQRFLGQGVVGQDPL